MRGAVWEVDALPPDLLTTTIRRSLTVLVDPRKAQEVQEREEADKSALRAALRRVIDGSE